MPLIEFGNGRAAEEGQAMQVRQGVRNVIFKPIDLANPVYLPTLSDLRSRIALIFSLASAVGRSDSINDLAMKIRNAVPKHAAAACQFMRRSIAELCVASHRLITKSTEAARRFHLARGYSEDEPAHDKFHTASGYPMPQRLVSSC
jgi:hypothetical protein